MLLGFVSQIQEFQLKISLPGRLVGALPITNISPALTARLRAATEAEERGEAAEALPALASLFREGEAVTVAVVEAARTPDGGRWSVVLSMAPARVMGPRVLAAGEVVRAAVASMEDHGWIMDVGSNTVRGFVTAKAMARLGRPAEEGEVVWGAVTRAGAGVVQLTPAPAKVWGGAPHPAPTVHALTPGAKVAATVVARLKGGLKVELVGGLAAYIPADQLEEPAMEVEEVEVGAELEARLLYILPTTNTIFLTLRDVRAKVLEGLKPGQVVEGATVESSTNSTVLLKLGGSFGIVNHRQLSEGKEVVKNVKKKFPPGQAVVARVVALDYSSGMAICTLQKSQVSKIVN